MERTTTLIFCGILVVIFYVIILGLIFADLWAGVRKAKKRGEYRTSDGYKRTIDKIARYFNMALALTLVDAAQIAVIFFLYWFYGYDIPMIPILTAIGTIYIAFVEIKSIREPADIKEKKQQDDFRRMVLQVAKDHEHPEQVLEDVINALHDTKIIGKQNSDEQKPNHGMRSGSGEAVGPGSERADNN